MSAFDRFLQALAFMTILPVNAKAAHAEDPGLFSYARFFPLAGVFVGLFSGSVFCLTALMWSGPVPALFAVVAGLVITGALHEDGLADTADGFGGGWTREQRLSIMKDSRLGTYGVLALGLGIALKAAALALLSPAHAFFGLIAAHAGARFAPVIILATQDYAGDPATARMAYAPERLAMLDARQAFLWTLLALIPILVMRPGAAIFGIGLGASLALALALYSRKAIGGYRGDVLGAAEQVVEIGFLLGLAAGASS